MRYIIKLDDGRFVQTSVKSPVFTDDSNAAEVWIDQKAAVAWCEEKNIGAEIIPIDMPVMEVVKARRDAVAKVGKKVAEPKVETE